MIIKDPDERGLICLCDVWQSGLLKKGAIRHLRVQKRFISQGSSIRYKIYSVTNAHNAFTKVMRVPKTIC
jgi:hypothetical protein